MALVVELGELVKSVLDHGRQGPPPGELRTSNLHHHELAQRRDAVNEILLSELPNRLVMRQFPRAGQLACIC